VGSGFSVSMYNSGAQVKCSTVALGSHCQFREAFAPANELPHCTQRPAPTCLPIGCKVDGCPRKIQALTGIERVNVQFSWVQFGLSGCIWVQLVRQEGLRQSYGALW
jgi:hypothetical protein